MKNKRIFSRFLVPTLVIGTFGLFAVGSNVLGQNDDTAATTTNINNVAPSFTVQPSDNGSDGTTPTNVGSNVTFTATASDPNNDDYYLAICKTDAIAPGNSAAPTCTGGEWVISSNYDDDEAASETYTVTGTENCGTAPGDESCPWYAFVCDGNGPPNGLCSASSQGDSPFKINHAGTFGTLTSDDGSAGTIEPGETVTFRMAVGQLADPDTDTAQDTMQMHICTTATTSFVYATNTCTGGAKICSSAAVDPTTTEASCVDTQSLTTVPTAHGSYDVKVYVEDGHDFPATGTLVQSYTVQDVAPVFSSYVADTTVVLTADTYKTLTRIVSYTDNNGDRDVTNLDTVVFEDTLEDNDCGASENICYRIDGVDPTALSSEAPAAETDGCWTIYVSDAGSGKTLTGTDNAVTVSCNYTIWFNATASENWEYNVQATDGTGVTDFGDTNLNIEINPLSAISVAVNAEETTPTIAYGTVAVGGTSLASVNTATVMKNKGNQIIDVLLLGTNMTAAGGTIDADKQEWHHTTADFTWEEVEVEDSAGPYHLETSAVAGKDTLGCLNRDMSVRAVHNVGTEDETIYWKIQIPAAQESGTYTGTNTFTSTDDADCTGTEY